MAESSQQATPVPSGQSVLPSSVNGVEAYYTQEYADKMLGQSKTDGSDRRGKKRAIRKAQAQFGTAFSTRDKALGQVKTVGGDPGRKAVHEAPVEGERFCYATDQYWDKTLAEAIFAGGDLYQGQKRRAFREAGVNSERTSATQQYAAHKTLSPGLLAAGDDDQPAYATWDCPTAATPTRAAGARLARPRENNGQNGYPPLFAGNGAPRSLPLSLPLFHPSMFSTPPPLLSLPHQFPPSLSPPHQFPPSLSPPQCPPQDMSFLRYPPPQLRQNRDRQA